MSNFSHVATLRAVVQPSDYRSAHTLLAYRRGFLITSRHHHVQRPEVRGLARGQGPQEEWVERIRPGPDGPGPSAEATEKPGCSGRGKIQRAPGLTIDQIVDGRVKRLSTVSRRSRGWPVRSIHATGLHAQAHLLLISANRSNTVDNGLCGMHLRARQWRGLCMLRPGSRL